MSASPDSNHQSARRHLANVLDIASDLTGRLELAARMVTLIVPPRQGVSTTKCHRQPLGYTACPREYGHAGECEHEVDLASVALNLQELGIDMEPEELDELYWETLEGMFGKRGLA